MRRAPRRCRPPRNRRASTPRSARWAGRRRPGWCPSPGATPSARGAGHALRDSARMRAARASPSRSRAVTAARSMPEVALAGEHHGEPASSAAATTSPSLTDPRAGPPPPPRPRRARRARRGREEGVAGARRRPRPVPPPCAPRSRPASTRLCWPAPTPEGLAVGGDHDGVGRGPGAHPPGQLDVAPLVVGGGRLGAHLPVRPGAPRWSASCTQESAPQAAQLERRWRRRGGASSSRVALRLATRTLHGAGAEGGATMTSACGPSATVRGHVRGARAAQGDHAAEGGDGVAFEGAPVGVGQGRRQGGAARVGVLDDGHGRPVPAAGELGHEAPGGVGVEEVQVGQRRAGVLDHAVPPTRLARRRGTGPRAGGGSRRSGARAGALQGKVQRGGSSSGSPPAPPASNHPTMAAS